MLQAIYAVHNFSVLNPSLYFGTLLNYVAHCATWLVSPWILERSCIVTGSNISASLPMLGILSSINCNCAPGSKPAYTRKQGK